MDRVAYVQHASTYRHFKHHIMYRHMPVGLAMRILFYACSVYTLKCLKIYITESRLLPYTNTVGEGEVGIRESLAATANALGLKCCCLFIRTYQQWEQYSQKLTSLCNTPVYTEENTFRQIKNYSMVRVICTRLTTVNTACITQQKSGRIFQTC